MQKANFATEVAFCHPWRGPNITQGFVMERKLEISFEGSFIRVFSTGDKSYDSALNLWQQVVAKCTEHNCFKVLGVANSGTYFKTMEAFSHAKLFDELGITNKYRIAWVELNPEAFETTRFIETVLANRGLPGRLFTAEAEAEEWLLSEER